MAVKARLVESRSRGDARFAPAWQSFARLRTLALADAVIAGEPCPLGFLGRPARIAPRQSAQDSLEFYGRRR